MAGIRTHRPYSSTYQEICFQAWYAAGHPPKTTQIATLLNNTPDEYGRVPDVILIARWRDELGWDVRADELDAKAQALVDDELVNARVLMLKEHAARARELQKMGLDYLRDEGFDSSSAAVNAIIRGADLEKESKGLSAQITKLFKMGDEELSKNAQALIERLNVPADAVVIDVGEVEEETEENPEEETKEDEE